MKSLGVILDQDMAMDKHKFTMICKTSQHHLRNIGNIKKFLDQVSAKTLVHSFVTSIINYCNALLFGLPKYQSNRLQLAGGFNNYRRTTKCVNYFAQRSRLLFLRKEKQL